MNCTVDLACEPLPLFLGAISSQRAREHEVMRLFPGICEEVHAVRQRVERNMDKEVQRPKLYCVRGLSSQR